MGDGPPVRGDEGRDRRHQLRRRSVWNAPPMLEISGKAAQGARRHLRHVRARRGRAAVRDRAGGAGGDADGGGLAARARPSRTSSRGCWTPGTQLAGAPRPSRRSPRPIASASLLAWADSPEVGPRAAFQALRKGILLSYYCLPHWARGRTRWTRRSATRGRSGRPRIRRRKTLSPLSITARHRARLRRGGGRLGRGRRHRRGRAGRSRARRGGGRGGRLLVEEDFDGAELSGYARMYLNGGGVATDDQSIGLLAGSCLGGGTVVNYTWCFRPPDFVREDWKQRFGLSDWAGLGLRRQPGRGLGPDLDQLGEQHPVGARPRDAGGAGEARVGLAGDAAQLQGLRGGGLPAVPLRLPDRGEAVDDEDVAAGRLGQRGADRRELPGGPGAARGRRGRAGRRGR